ncbi:XRE family transcriptional regulator [Stenomitos frigidus ULC18]|uniref:XRE family transcriptional regulator n=2 Tax=Stenomitos TaxID=1844270 RepID=A0A2T1EB39_9CYAN|nr:XRE family transcriptional regulator [Stenomitos frigidus ULC18]
MRKMICRLPSLIDERNLKLSEAGKPDKRLTQRKLAEDIDVATTTLNRLYNNDFTRVDVNTIERLCNYFECEVGDLFVLREVEP